MTTPEELEVALRDFKKECDESWDCKRCKYESVCKKFKFWDNSIPKDWGYFGGEHFGLTEKEWAELF